MQLRYDYPLSTVDDESATASHHWEFAHVDTLFFAAGFIFQAEGHVKCRAKSFAVTQRIE